MTSLENKRERQEDDTLYLTFMCELIVMRKKEGRKEVSLRRETRETRVLVSCKLLVTFLCFVSCVSFLYCLSFNAS